MCRARPIRSLAGLAAVLTAALAPARADDPAAALADVRVVPRPNQWSLVDPAQRGVLRELAALPVAQRDRLLRSDDARLRGIGIFIAEQQGDVAALLSLPRLLSDDAATVPCAAPVAHVGEYRTQEQTVADYLTSVYLEWFGVDVDKSRERFIELLGPMKDRPGELVLPWVVRLRRAKTDERATKTIKEQIGALPEQVRWAVVTLGYSESLYAKADSRALLAALSEQTLQMVRARDKLLPDEPLFRASSSFRDAVLGQYEQLMSD